MLPLLAFQTDGRLSQVGRECDEAIKPHASRLKSDMSEPIISAKTRNVFREYFVGTTLQKITDAFDGAGVRCDLDYTPNVSGQRRTLVEQYYRTVDWTDARSVRPVMKVYETLLRELAAPGDARPGWPALDSDDERKATGDKLRYWLHQDRIEWVGGRLVRSAGTTGLDELAATAPKLEGTHLAMQIQRIKDSVDSDPALAIGTAKELIETVCKTILEERGKELEGSPDIPTLTKALLKELKLVPEGVPTHAKGGEAIKGVLRSLGTIGNDLAQLRGLYGTGHGKSAKTQGLQPRHARLAVGSAATLVTFLFETHLANDPSQPPAD